jgi:protein involved in polysaccharide export with SLBB domain
MLGSKSLCKWSNLMRRAAKTTILATAAATVVLAAAVLYSLDFATGQSAPNESTHAPTSSEKVLLGIGDRLKISFFEPINMPDTRPADGSGAESQGALRTFYQRMDLSGEYLIDQDGALSIPLLGRLQVEGRELNAVRADLAASFSSVMQRTADVNVTIIDRSPVYVVGPVKKPGAYKYTPGMIVLHAVALAGGIDRGDGNLSSVVEGVREIGRLRTAADQVRRLLARRARLRRSAMASRLYRYPFSSQSSATSPAFAPSWQRRGRFYKSSKPDITNKRPRSPRSSRQRTMKWTRSRANLTRWTLRRT